MAWNCTLLSLPHYRTCTLICIFLFCSRNWTIEVQTFEIGLYLELTIALLLCPMSCLMRTTLFIRSVEGVSRLSSLSSNFPFPSCWEKTRPTRSTMMEVIFWWGVRVSGPCRLVAEACRWSRRSLCQRRWERACLTADKDQPTLYMHDAGGKFVNLMITCYISTVKPNGVLSVRLSTRSLGQLLGGQLSSSTTINSGWSLGVPTLSFQCWMPKRKCFSRRY